MPVIIAGTDEQKKKYLGRMTEEPLMCVSENTLYTVYTFTTHTFRPDSVPIINNALCTVLLCV